MAEDCEHSISCCDPNPWDYSLVAYPVYTNAEQTIFVPCPEGFVCDGPGVYITIAAGSVTFRPTTEEQNENAPALLQEKVQETAEREADRINNRRVAIYYFSDPISGSCPAGTGLSVGTHPYIIDSTTVSIPPGAFSSVFGQADANTKAQAALDALLAGCSCQSKLISELVWTYQPGGAFGTTFAEGDHGNANLTSGGFGVNVGVDFVACVNDDCNPFTLHVAGDYTISGDISGPPIPMAWIQVLIDGVQVHYQEILGVGAGACTSATNSFNVSHLIDADAYSIANGCHQIQISMWMTGTGAGGCVSDLTFQLSTS